MAELGAGQNFFIKNLVSSDAFLWDIKWGKFVILNVTETKANKINKNNFYFLLQLYIQFLFQKVKLVCLA